MKSRYCWVISGIAMLLVVKLAALHAAEVPATLFPTDLPSKQWSTFSADGFSAPACGVIYSSKDEVACGMPLGGIDTGCIDLETNGMFGFSTLFNTHVPRLGPLKLPVLGLSAGGKTWVLCDKRPKRWENQDGLPVKNPLPENADPKLDGVETAKEIHYWGHYPVADLEFVTDAPVQVGLRAWAPFLPGDVVASMMPAIVFEVRLRNAGDSTQEGTIAFSFPGPDPKEAGTNEFARKEVTGSLSAVEIGGKLASYAIGVVGEEKPRFGGALGGDGAAWNKIASTLPPVEVSQPGSSVAVDFVLPAGREKVVRFVLTWCAPTWNNVGYNWASQSLNGKKELVRRFTHMYAKYHPSAARTAELVAKDHVGLLRRILAWQQVVYRETSLPVWLRESLVNILHLIAEDGLWAQAKDPIPGWVQESDGLFGLNECPRECPQIECIPCSLYGNMPLVYFFPELALSTLRGYKGYQDSEGAPPWIFGGCTGSTPYIEFAMPSRGYQVTMNGPCYVDMVDRYLMCHGTKGLAEEFLPSVKKAVAFTIDLNRSPEGVVSMPDRTVSVGGVGRETEWFEQIYWYGIVPHVGGVHMAMLRMAARMAEQTGDNAFAEQCRQWIEKGQKILDTKMWAGNYYLAFWDEKADKKSDLIFAYQFDGEWMARHHGLPGVFRSDRVGTTLTTIKKFCVPPTRYGAINFIKPDKKLLQPGEFPLGGIYKPYDFFVPEVAVLGMTYMYYGQNELGLELTRRCTDGIVCEQGTTWTQPNIILGDTGARSYGSDYYQNMMLWSLPAAIEGKDLAAPCQPGGLVQRVVEAAKNSNP